MSRRSSAEIKRRPSPKKNNKHNHDHKDKQTSDATKKEAEATVSVPAPSSSNAPFQPFARRPVVHRVLRPLPVDARIQNQIKAAEIAYMATQFVMAVCFIFVPYTCYKSIFYLPPEQQQGMMGGEPWEQYFELN